MVAAGAAAAGFRGGGGGFRGGGFSRSAARSSVTRPSGFSRPSYGRPSQPISNPGFNRGNINRGTIANRPGNIVNNRPGNIVNNRPGNIINNRPIDVGDVNVVGGGDYYGNNWDGCCYYGGMGRGGRGFRSRHNRLECDRKHGLRAAVDLLLEHRRERHHVPAVRQHVVQARVHRDDGELRGCESSIKWSGSRLGARQHDDS